MSFIGTTWRIPALTHGMGRGVIPGGHRQLVTTARGAAFTQADLVVVAGTPGASPAVPTTPADSIALAKVTLTDATVSILDAAITDLRVPCLAASYWTALPISGVNGQIVTLADGELYKRMAGA